MQGWLRQATPPRLVLEPEGPGRVSCRQLDQTVAGPFFRAYAGSGLVSQCLARFQPTPRRFKVARIVSLLTGWAVTPCSKLTLAASARVHRLVGWLNVRGLWCNRARNCSAWSASKAARLVWGRREPGRSAASPLVLNAWIASRTVWSSQPSWRAMVVARSPRALASRIWHRRRTKASDERKPASTCWRSASVSGRTKIGCNTSPVITDLRLSARELH